MSDNQNKDNGTVKMSTMTVNKEAESVIKNDNMNMKTEKENFENRKAETENDDEIYDFHNATGIIGIRLTNDMLFHMVMQKSQKALKGLVCALNGLKPDEVRSVAVMNPIDYGNYMGKEVILDVRIELNHSEIMDVELQLYYDKNWKQRSLLYLCRAFDTLGESEDYSLLKPTTLIAITERRFMENPGEQEFYAKYSFLNASNQHEYSSLLHLNVLYLDQIDMAKDEDYENELVHWAKIFRATTWEDLKALVDGNPVLEEVANRMYKSNIIPEERTMIEAHQRFLAQKQGAYEAGIDKGMEKAQEIIAQKDAEISEKDAMILEKDTALSEKNRIIAELNEEIINLKKKQK